MIWERDPLFAKSKLFFERAFDEPPESSLYGLWCSLGLELLARSAVASVSPTLLAEPDEDHRFLLYALNRAPEKTPPKSIAAYQVFALCQTLFDSFSKEDLKEAQALVNRRNAELHSAEDAFDHYPPNLWLPGFYRICRALVGVLGESLEELFGTDQARIADEILKESENEATSRVKATIAAHKRVFDAKTPEEQQAAMTAARENAARLSFAHHHRVACPACQSDASVQGELFGDERVTIEEAEVVVRRSVSPRTFSCTACGMKLSGFAELAAAGLGSPYSRTQTSTPAEYYGLIDPDSDDMTEFISRYMEDAANEYDNE
jgi:hypothetical protein